MKTPSVLLILEEQHDLNTYGTILRDKGYQTLMCTSLGEGINFLENDSVSLVILGQETPSFGSSHLLEYSLRRRPEVPVLIVARVLDMRCYLEAMERGATDYLERPAPRDLAWVVETQVLRCGICRDPLGGCQTQGRI